MYKRQALQDKLGVDMHLFKVGEYKSAAEPYILDAASPESKEADLFWMKMCIRDRRCWWRFGGLGGRCSGVVHRCSLRSR